MKAKTLLIAAAALAAGVISSQAQVYSQNIVGYANVVTASSGLNYLVSVPFKVGVSNGCNEVFASAPDYTTLLVWNPAASGFATFQKDSGSATGWTDGNSPVSPVSLPVGMGFFITPGQDNTTNTFAGVIAVAVGTSNITTFASSGLNYLVGAPVPYAGSVTNGNNSTGGLNMNALPDYTTLLIWDSASSGFATYQRDSGSATGWTDGNSPLNPPSLNVGQGFFLTPGVDGAQWTVGL